MKSLHSPHIPEYYLPIQAAKQALPCHHYFITHCLHLIYKLSSCLPLLPLWSLTPTPHPCHLHTSTGRHPIIHIPIRSRYPHHLNLPCLTTSATLYRWYTQKTTNPHCAFYPSATLHTSISPSSALSSPYYADYQPPLPMFQSHICQNTLGTSSVYLPPVFELR